MEMEWDFIIRLCVAGLCGTVIGLDREYRVKDAGFRTHFLVALGSALMMIVSQYGFADILTHTGVGLDPSRIAAQVVSGDRKSTRLNSSHNNQSRMPSSA